jgi:hypothetical protein
MGSSGRLILTGRAPALSANTRGAQQWMAHRGRYRRQYVTMSDIPTRGRSAVSIVDPAFSSRVAPQLRVAGAGMSLTDSVYDRLLRERIIFLGQPVDDAIANQLCAQLLLLAAEDPKRDINLYINSPGGSVTAGMAIYDTMQFIE